MTWQPGFGGNKAATPPTTSTGTPAAQTAAPPASSASGNGGDGDVDWNNYAPEDGGTIPDAPPPPEGGRRRKDKGEGISPGKYVAWVDAILRWPRGTEGATVLAITFTTTGYENFGWDQEPGPNLLNPDNEKAVTALSYWTDDLVKLYAAMGFPDDKWVRRPAADGTPRRVPPWSTFWHVNARGVRAPIAFDLEIGRNAKGFNYLKTILAMAGPRLAPLPTSLPVDADGVTSSLARQLGWKHEIETFITKNGPVTAAKIPRQTWLANTDLVSIEPLLPKKRGA